MDFVPQGGSLVSMKKVRLAATVLAIALVLLITYAIVDPHYISGHYYNACTGPLGNPPRCQGAPWIKGHWHFGSGRDSSYPYP